MVIHASVHDGNRVLPHVPRPFAHNDVCALHAALRSLREGESIAVVEVAVAVESVYGIDGTVAPLFRAIPNSMGLETAWRSRCGLLG